MRRRSPRDGFAPAKNVGIELPVSYEEEDTCVI